MVGRSKYIVFTIVIVILFISLSVQPGFRVQQYDDNASVARHLISQANIASGRLRAHPKTERSEPEYLEIMGIYKRAIESDKDHSCGDEALLAMAHLAEDMAEQLKKSRYYYNAIDYYQQLVHNYPVSPHRALAIIQTGQIFEKNLADREAAVQAYHQVIDLYPTSVVAREASANIFRLTGDKPVETAEESAENLITGIRSFAGPDYARIVIDLGAPIKYRKTADGNSLSLQLPQAKLLPQIAKHNLVTDNTNLVKEIYAEETNDGVQIKLAFDHLRDYAIFNIDNPERLVIDLRGRTNHDKLVERPIDEAADAKLAQEYNEKRLTFMRALALKVKRIVIDAGHGGHDTGALGPEGLQEKDLVLDVALRLRTIIKEHMPDVDVVMTRDKDFFVPLEERTAVANAQGADLFISIHANSSPIDDSTGVETYYLSIDATKDELAVATRENSSTARSARDLQSILQQIMLDDKILESHNLANLVQQSLVKGLGRNNPAAGFNRGVKKAPFIVLIGANMPSILSEIAFVSNPQQAKILQTGAFKQQIAESLFDGVRHYVEFLAKSPTNLTAEK